MQKGICMFKKFINGLVFGAGFTISFIVLWFLATFFIQPLLSESLLEHLNNHHVEITQEQSTSLQPKSTTTTKKSPLSFHELSIDEQIQQSSAIAVARYEPTGSGQVDAIITEFLKKDPTTSIYYNVGDKFPAASYTPKKNTNYGDGVVIFFTGSPASMRASMSFSGDRILGLGDLPLELLRKKSE